MPQIILENFFQGQNQDAPLIAGANTLTHMLCCSPHEQLGVVMSGPGPVKLPSPGGIVGVPTVIVPTALDAIYMFSTGKIWKYDLFFNSFTDLGSTAGSVTDAAYFDGYIYYSRSSADTLGRIDIATDTLTNSFASFTEVTAPNTQRHPMFILGGNLYIGNEHVVALVDSQHIFTGDALDMPADYRVTTMTNIGEELLIGTENKLDFQHCKTFRWNTWSESFSAETTVDAKSIGYFIQDNGQLFLVAMDPDARVFAYGEPYPQEMTKIPQSNDSLIQTVARPSYTPNHIARFRNRTYFPMGGTPYYEGIYSYHGLRRGFPNQVAMEMCAPGTDGNTNIVTVASIDEYFFFSYVTGTDSGIAFIRLSTSGPHDTSTIITPYIALDRENQKDFSVKIPYSETLTGDYDLQVSASANYGNFNLIETRHDVDRKMYTGYVDIANANTIRLKVTMTNGDNAFPIEKIILDFK